MKLRLALFLVSLLTPLLAAGGVEDDFAQSRGVTADHTSLLVVDLATGEELVSFQADLPLIPASIMKCVTTATLLSRMDEDTQFHTEVWLTGPERDGVVEGNILVKGSGDPSLNSRYVEGAADICAEIAEALAARGITTVDGRIVVDEDVWSGPSVPPSWMQGDLSHAYGTGSHGLNFEDNASGSRSVANPAAVFDTRLRAALAKNGIAIEGKSVRDGGRHLLLDHVSVALDEIMRSCMMRSDNQYAEALLRSFAVAAGHRGATDKGAQLETEYWKKHKAPMQGVNIVDGSGLSRNNRVTARFMADVLRQRADNPYYASFFPLAGVEGTLRNFLAGTPLEGYIAMKTGSMNGIQCYAGYKLDDDYVPTHIIVVMMNELKDRGAARDALKTLLLNLFTNQPNA